MIKQKSLQDYLDEDPSLREKITYEEFQRRQNCSGQIDDDIEEAYNAYLRILESEQEEDQSGKI